MAYILKKGTGGGGGGGDATAVNQQIQIDQVKDNTTYQSVFINDDNLSVFKNNSAQSLFGDTNNDSVFATEVNGVEAVSVFKSNDKSVFKENNDISTFNTDQKESLLYKSLVNDNSGSNTRTNQVKSSVFTAATALGAAALLQTFLSNNPCVIVAFTSSQTALSHDLFLLYTDL